MTENTDDIHAKAKARFSDIWGMVEDERELAITDRRFVGVSGAQWEGTFGEAFENKVKIEVDKVHLAVTRVINDYRANRITVDFTSKDGSDMSDLSDICDGLYRADEQRSTAQEAYDTALQEGVTGGYGAWRLIAVEEDEDDDDNERQVIDIEPIFDADQSVFFDPNAKRQDKSDAQYCFVLSSITRASYEDEYEVAPTTWPVDDETSQFDWNNEDSVYIADYYVKSKAAEPVVIYVHADGSTEQFDADDLSPELKAHLKDVGARVKERKTVKRTIVEKYIMSGDRILSGPERLAGKHIPIIPYYGSRVYIDNLERCNGVVRRAKDAQRLKNIMLSKLAEQSAQSPYEKPIFAPEQITADIAQEWATANVDNPAYLRANPLFDQQGNIISAGPVGYTKPPEVAPATAAVASIIDQDLSEVLGNQQAGEEINANTSGKAVELVQSRLDMQSFGFMDNMAKAMRRSGQVWLSMAKDLYVEEDRMMRTVGKQKESGSVHLGEKVVDHTGATVAKGDLSRAKFEVDVEVGPSSSSKKQAMIRTLRDMISVTSDPETQAVLGGLMIQNMEGEGMNDVHEWQRKKLVGMGVLKPTEADIEAQNAASESQQPDPNAVYLQSEADKNAALTAKAQADTEKSLAQAENYRAETADTLAGIPRADRQQAIDAVAEIDREAGRRSPNPPINNGLRNGIPPGQQGA